MYSYDGLLYFSGILYNIWTCQSESGGVIFDMFGIKAALATHMGGVVVKAFA